MNEPQNAPDDHSAEPQFPQDASSPPEDPYEGAVPPGYDWPTHGGYLGCLLGLMASCLIGGFAAKLVGIYTYYHQITGITNVAILVCVILLTTILFTNLGWRLGRRFFREYSPRPTWGESDTYQPKTSSAAAAASLTDASNSDDNTSTSTAE